jgi:molybdopterin synthase sulfur carrier subunit
MKAQFCATLRPIFGGKTVEFNLPTGATVQQLIDTFTTEFPPLQAELLDEHVRLFAHARLRQRARCPLFTGRPRNNFDRRRRD